MPKRLLKTTAWLSLLTYLLVFMVGGLAVCYGEDGHVATGITLKDSCCGQTDSSSLSVFQNPTRDTLLMFSGFCDPCVDIPVSMSVSDHRFNCSQKSPFQTQCVPFVHLVNGFTPLADFTSKSRIPQVSVAMDATIISLQTIILLI